MSGELYDDNDRWSQSGIKFTIASTEDVDEIKLFILENFYPDEPIARSIGVSRGDGWVDRFGRYLMNKDLVVDPIQQNTVTIPCSIIARSTEDNSIVGVRMGAMYYRHAQKNNSFVPDWIGLLPTWLVPTKFIHAVNAQGLMRDLHYSQHDAFDGLKDIDVIYFANALCVSKLFRGKGLGAELLKRAYKIALEAGCRYTYVLATGMYSQGAFHRLGGTKVLCEKRYEDYRKDSYGRRFLDDTREHEIIQVILVDHNVALSA